MSPKDRHRLKNIPLNLADLQVLIRRSTTQPDKLRDTENKPQSLYLLPESMCLLSASGSSTLRYIARKVGTSTGYKNVKSKDKI
ncbi:unnamed protein product [Ceratitis capitata]|uniref:(Mediterranean fruit fly) hypothetical protein n=1 Tax=Ceratitis capitata TaxID=7213 RepID=A0A811VBB6_CERCA|nr:unnamed protein product [Ceratitis capitata]